MKFKALNSSQPRLIVQHPAQLPLSQRGHRLFWSGQLGLCLRDVFVSSALASSLLMSGGLLARPAAAERIVDVTPSVNAQNVLPSTSISGVFDNDSQGTVDANTVRIYLNDRDITAASTITRNFFSYRPEQPLSRGSYDVRVDYETAEGLRRSVGWQFEVSPQNLAAVESVTHNGSNTLGNGATLLTTLKGTPAAKATIYLIEDGRTLKMITANEVSSGVYVATLPVTTSSNIKEGIVVGRLELGGQTTYGVADQPARLQGSAVAVNPAQTSSPAQANQPARTPKAPSSEAPLTPKLTSPQQDERITTSGFTLTGQTSPNAKVQVTVVANTPLLGNVVSLGAERLVEQEVQADAQGVFEVKVPSPTILKRETRYQVNLRASLNGKSSTPLEVELKQR